MSNFLSAMNAVTAANPAQSQLRPTKSSCCGSIGVGVILFLGAFPLLFWNEQRAVRRYDALEEGESQVITIDSLDPSNNGELVHFTANLFNGGSNLTDSTFGIECLNADCLMLQRSTEMYQWDQNQDESYRSEWFGSINSPVDQGRKNPTSFRFPSQNFIANPMMAGAYELPSEIVNYVIKSRSPIDVSVDQISDATLQQEATATNFGGFRFGTGTEQNPDIGDERISFLETRPSEISVVGVQTDKTVTAFVSESGKGGGILIYKTGNFSSTELFEMENDANRVATIALRVVGFAVMAFGQILIWSPLKSMADVIPIVGSVIGCGINFVSITIAAVLSAITIGIAWLIYRPILGLIVLGSSLAVIGLCAFGVYMLLNRNGNGNGNNNYHNNNNNNNNNNGPSNVEELEYDVVEAVAVAVPEREFKE
jgi:hypothetical protein